MPSVLEIVLAQREAAKKAVEAALKDLEFAETVVQQARAKYDSGTPMATTAFERKRQLIAAQLAAFKEEEKRKADAEHLAERLRIDSETTKNTIRKFHRPLSR